MNLDPLKEKLGDATFADLKKYVDDLQGQRDAARSESIDGRKRLKSDNEALAALRSRLFDKLGIASEDDIDALPDAKGQADAVKQFEAKLKRMETQLTGAFKERDDLGAKLKDSALNVALEKALSGHDWLDRDVASMLARSKATFDGESILYTADDGKTIPLDEGVKLIASAKPHLLKAQGAAGSGHGTGNSGGSGNQGATPTIDLAAIYAARQPGAPAAQKN